MVLTSPVKFTVGGFVVLMLLLPQTGGPNEDARLATMAALVSDRTFAITSYQWTQDWALSPVNGHVYANKPPGPSILGAPGYWLIDQVVLMGQEPDEAARLELRFRFRRLYGHALALLLQAIPYACLTLFTAHFLRSADLSPGAIQFGTLGILFGTTASLFMNTYFGHGLAAFFVLAAVLCFLQRYYTASGLLLGWGALSDYGAALITIPFLASIVVREGRLSLRPLRRVVAGAALPAVIWVAYHWSIFGHPLYLATRFSDPALLGEVAQYSVWGIFSTTVNMTALLALLAGPHRGLLFTQPWVLVALIASLILLITRKIRHPDFPALIVLSAGGLGLMLLANSSFNGWHGGWTAGPRYISSILPVFSILAAMVYGAVSRSVRDALWLSMAASILLFAAAYTTTILAEPAPIWQFYWHRLIGAITAQPVVTVVRITVALVIIILASFMDLFYAAKNRSL